MRWGPAVGLTVLALLAAPWLLPPPCPQKIVIATGSRDGAYYAFAEQYRELLADDGIELEVRSSAGSLENIELLAQGDVSLAFVQGGVGSDDAGRLRSLGSLYLEPVWIFSRSTSPVQRLSELRGKRVAIGPEGSGSRAIAVRLFEKSGVEAEFSDLGGAAAADALLAEEIDAALLVTSPRAAVVERLLAAEGIQLMNFQRAAAFERQYPYLRSVMLAEGVVDLAHDLPARPTVLIAPTASLVARDDLHPALAPLLLKAAHRIHEAGGVLESPGEFPSAQGVDFPLSESARRYFKSGPSLFYRYLPFQLAAWLDRVKVLLLPMCTLLFPLVKAAPPIYRWSIRSKIYRWYRVLRDIDLRYKDTQGAADYAEDIERLRNLEHELASVAVPLSYMEEFYNLRVHIDLVRRKLEGSPASQPVVARRAA